MNPEIQRLIDESERLVEQIQSNSLDSWCRDQGLNREKMSQVLAEYAAPESEARARAMFEDDLIEIQREIEARVPASDAAPASVRANAVRQRRRFGMV